MAANTTSQLEAMINSLSGAFMRWVLPIFALSAAGWAWNAETRLQKLEQLHIDVAHQGVQIENLETKVENLPIIEERIANIRDTLREIHESLK